MIPFLRIFLLLFVSSSTAFGLAWAQDKKPVAFSGNVIGDTTSTRFFTDFTGPVSVQTFYLDGPYRLIVDLGDVDFAFPEARSPEARGLISDIAFTKIAENRSRIVISLSNPAEIIRASMQKVIDEDHYRFLLDLDATSEARFATLLNAQKLVLAAQPVIAEKGSRVAKKEKPTGRFTVVIDPGHGGIDGGASGRSCLPTAAGASVGIVAAEAAATVGGIP